MKPRERLPERPQATVARAAPAGTACAILQLHAARPELARSVSRPFCREPSTYFTRNEQRAVDGFTSTDTAAGWPWYARCGTKLKRSGHWLRGGAGPGEVTPRPPGAPI